MHILPVRLHTAWITLSKCMQLLNVILLDATVLKRASRKFFFCRRIQEHKAKMASSLHRSPVENAQSSDHSTGAGFAA